jgi:DNA-binding MarR family transcriptional regulator
MRIEDEIKVREFHNPTHRLVVNIGYTSSWLNSHSSRFMKRFGLSIQQFNLLRILRGQHPKPAGINLLIERMVDKQSNASRLVERMRTKGLVDRTVCPEDRRRVDVVITQQGLDLLEKIDRELYAFQDGLVNLTPQEIDTLSGLLDKMRG